MALGSCTRIVMTEYARFGKQAGIAGAVEVRRVIIDDLSHVRYIHETSLRLHAGSAISDEEIEAFRAQVNTPEYGDWLLQNQVFGAWLKNEMVATGGWSPADDTGSGVRLHSIFVRPLFNGAGLGRRIVLEVEDRARRVGYDTFSVRSTLNAVDFFQHLGYAVTSHGLGSIIDGVNVPVAFLRKSYLGLKRPATVN